MATTYSAPFMQKPDAGFRLGDIRSMWDAIANSNGASTAYGIAAAGTTQATATQLTSVSNQIDTGTSNQGVALPSSKGLRSTPYNMCYVYNNTGATIIVYAFNPASGTADTINGVAGATGVSMPNNTFGQFVSAKPGVWFADVASVGDFTTITLAGSSSGTTILQASSAASGTLTFPAATTTLVGRTTTDTLTNKTVTDLINQDTVWNTAIYNIVNTTTLAAVPGLSVAVTTSGIYSFLAKLPVTTATSSGTSIGLISTAGPVTATTYAENGVFTTAAGTTAVAQSATFSNAVGATNFAVIAELSGVIQVNTGGTIALGAASNVASTVTMSINTGGFLQLTRIS